MANDRIGRLTTSVRWAGPTAYAIALVLEVHYNGVPWGRARLLAFWNAAVVLNVLGAGLGRFTESVRNLSEDGPVAGTMP